MKVFKIVLPIILVAVLSLAWLSFFTGSFGEYSAYKKCMKDAQISLDEKLYEQAIECYKESLSYELSESTYMRIKETYDKLYGEEHTAFIRNLYIDDMALASEDFPKNELFWVKQIQLYIEAYDYSEAYTIAKKALNYGASGSKLNALYKQLLYMEKVDYKLFTSFKTALNGYISVCDGTNSYVIDDQGGIITSNYKFVGLINDDGKGLYTNDIDTRFLDANEVPRARFDIDVEDAGYYNETSGFLPVKVDGVWKYMDLDGKFLPGEFEVAGSFYNHQAVALNGTTWVVIDEKGKQKELKGFEDIKLDMYGCHVQNDIVIAKKGGKYHLYDVNFKQINNFEAEEMDICIDSERIAFKNNGKWGYVNSKGKVVQKPMFAKAKSFANGYAAVCNDKGQWGFINENYEVVIGYKFMDAYYFTGGETCLVSTTEETFQLLHFMFD